MKWIDIWADRESRVHSDYTLSFVTTCLHIENKFEKMNEISTFLGNLTIRVHLMCLNLFLENKYNSKLVYVGL
jgi:hypothetical protein